MATPMVQRLAHAAKADGLQCAEVARLARLGTHGLHIRNTHAELLTALRPSPLTPALTTISLPL
eukprot:1805555-Alexandrium_andersonii.AAC.1